MIRWNYIVIGAGSAGAVIANRLSENSANKVLLLEAGNSDRSLYVRLPAGVIKTIASERLNWKYPGAPDRSKLNMSYPWAGGRVLGGSSSINGMMFVRGHPGDFDRWAALGCTGWDYQSVLPYFRKLEHFEGGADQFRGDSGPQWVSFQRHDCRTVDLFVEAAESAGHIHVPDYNGASMEGVSVVQASQKNGQRFNTARGYLDPIRSRENLCILTGCHVTRILFENKRATGVAYRRDSIAEQAYCDGEVIVSAGAIGSPHLLQHSGVGDPAALRRFGIDVVAENRNVGRNLQEHPAVALVMKTRHPSFNDAVVNPIKAVTTGLNFLFRRRGAITASTGSAQVFVKTRDGLDRPNIHLIFTPASWGEDPVRGTAIFPRMRSLLTGILLLRPEGRGSVELTSSDPLEKPSVCHELVGTNGEITQITEGISAALNILRQAPLSVADRDFVTPVGLPSNGAEWADFIRQTSFRGDHPSCTCAMGVEPNSVLDPQLRVRGVSGLRVADASIMPEVTSGNTNAPTIMIGEKASDMILKQYA